MLRRISFSLLIIALFVLCTFSISLADEPGKIKNIAIKKVDGGSLFGEAFSKTTAVKSGSNQLSKIMSKYPQAAYHVEIGKPEIMSVDHNTNKSVVKLNLKLNLDKDFTNELESVLKAISYQQLTNVNISEWGWDGDPISCGKTKLNSDVIVIMFANNNLLSRGMANRLYFLNNKNNLLNDNKIIGSLTAQHSAFAPKASIQLYDSSDSILDSIQFKLSDKYDNYNSVNNTQFGFPSLGEYNSPLLMQGQYRSDLLFVIDKYVDFDVTFEADISLLDKVASIKVAFEQFSDNK